MDDHHRSGERTPLPIFIPAEMTIPVPRWVGILSAIVALAMVACLACESWNQTANSEQQLAWAARV